MFKYVFGVLMLCTLSFAQAEGSAAESQVMCDQEYALCTSARCIPDPTDPTKKALCNCDVFVGKSLGATSCDKRKPQQLSNDVKAVTSTFSFQQMPPKEAMYCPDGAVWTDCLDYPCVVDPSDPNKALCSCAIVTTGKSVTFGGDCDTSTCKNAFWSAAATSTNFVKAAQMLEAKVNNVNICKAQRDQQ